MSYGIGTHLSIDYDNAIPLVKAALKEQGFGVLTEIDVKKTLFEKIGAVVEPYVILGACNPHLAHRALQIEPDIGLLLPCNVTVRSEAGGSRVDIADPNAMMGIAGASSGVAGTGKLDEVASEARSKLVKVIEALESRQAA